jgi:hypothetical protein
MYLVCGEIMKFKAPKCIYGWLVRAMIPNADSIPQKLEQRKSNNMSQDKNNKDEEDPSKKNWVFLNYEVCSGCI